MRCTLLLAAIVGAVPVMAQTLNAQVREILNESPIFQPLYNNKGDLHTWLKALQRGGNAKTETQRLRIMEKLFPGRRSNALSFQFGLDRSQRDAFERVLAERIEKLFIGAQSFSRFEAKDIAHTIVNLLSP